MNYEAQRDTLEKARERLIATGAILETVLEGNASLGDPDHDIAEAIASCGLVSNQLAWLLASRSSARREAREFRAAGMAPPCPICERLAGYGHDEERHTTFTQNWTRAAAIADSTIPEGYWPEDGRES